jgi:8-oxo-dGTP pyrophosphatase MutT (NUDIX family)
LALNSAPSDPPFPLPFDVNEFEQRLRALHRRKPFLFPREAVPDHFRHSSVLICFWREESDLRVLLTKRAATLRGHPGQMSFPGGKLEDGEDWIAGALRETEEEVGIPTDRIEVLGRLDDAWSGAGHLLVPVVGWLAARPRFAANPDEVETVHTPSVASLFAPEVYTLEEANLGGEIYYNSTLRWEEGSVFGLSSDLLIEAMQWASGFESAHGPERLSSLRSWLRFSAEEEARTQAEGRKNNDA